MFIIQFSGVLFFDTSARDGSPSVAAVLRLYCQCEGDDAGLCVN